ncbi:hypothetical protein [Fonticella tunisiensis]|uniref:Flagellar protein FliT n=1 Tax=Fonticella tunisiensis TaxID=1096341 RepID=A0A4R7KA11_9CLOT|nr:hypothetical protein [Fonticella tunisiensis]TDT50618.1 hypothetical protein EDD71_12635 [Fonticella tunisiensis]
MENDLMLLLTEFKNITMNLCSFLENEDYDKINELIEKRESLINRMKSIEYNSQDFISISEELNLIKWEEKLHILMFEKQKKLKENLSRISIGKSINASYNKKFYVDPIFLNKKI